MGSLEDQRLKRLEEEQKRKQQEEEALAKEKHEEELRLIEEKNLRLENELKRRKQEIEMKEAISDSHITRSLTPHNSHVEDTIVEFDRMITVRVNGYSYRFNQVYGKIPTKTDFFGKHYLVKPVVDSQHNENNVSFLLSEIELEGPFWTSSDGKVEIHRLEKELEIVRKINHENIISLYESKITHNKSGGWKISLLTEHCPLSQVSDLLDIVDTVNMKVVQNFATQILDGLENIHKFGISHKLVNVESIYLFRNAEIGETSVKLGRVCYGYRLLEMNSHHSFSQNNIVIPQKRWIPPELSLKSGSNPTKKSDVYDFGTVICQLIEGKNVVNKFKSPKDFLESPHAFENLQQKDIYGGLKEFLEKSFNESPKKRYSPFELLTSKFFRDNDIYSLANNSVNIALTPNTPETSGSSRRRSTNNHMQRMTSNSGQHVVFPRQTYSRYEHDFSELNVLGKGGYGEVVKVRNKIDGQFYAVKKIQSSQSKLDKIIGEVWLLSRLNHQNIVRYITAWIEEDFPLSPENAISDSEGCTDEESESYNKDGKSIKDIIKKTAPSGGLYSKELSLSTPLDFSKSGPDIVFGYSSTEESDSDSSSDSELESESDRSEESDVSEEGTNDDSQDSDLLSSNKRIAYDTCSENSDDDDESDDENSNENLEESDIFDRSISETKSHVKIATDKQSSFTQSTSSSSRMRKGISSAISRQQPTRNTLFIQMEYCENRTLADLIKDGLSSQPDEYWRLFRQIIDALSYIHGNGIIHRDLKPVNVFIGQGTNVKIGDFGLAKSIGQTLSNSSAVADIEEELTQEVGTSLYIAPEVLEGGGGIYDSKVDMYSLGIIFFEMVFPMKTAMERIGILRAIRNTPVSFPDNFLTPRYEKENSLISQLLNHNPTMRPTAKQLQSSPLVPTPHEDELVEKTLQKIVNSRGDSHWISQVCNALFSKELDSISALLYDRGENDNRKSVKEYLLMNHLVTSISEIFQLHGAIPTDDRSLVFPSPSIYEYGNLAKLMDRSGTILQLPYDLTFPFARKLAQAPINATKSYYFGTVYRERADTPNKGTEPRKCNEISFDIVSTHLADIAFNDAEALKVLDEILNKIPSMESENTSIVLNHCDILDSILKFCSVPQPHRSAALMLLGQFGMSPALPDTKAQILDQQNLSSATLTDLELFGFRLEINNAKKEILKKMANNDPGKLFYEAIEYLHEVVSNLRIMGVKRPIYLAPLSHYNPKFYKGGVMFQVIIEEKRTKTPVFLAGGGRYDYLVRSLRNQMGLDKKGHSTRAVGLNLSLDLLYQSMIVYLEGQSKKRVKMSFHDTEDTRRWTKPRCDVLVTSFNSSNNQDNCLKILKMLWDQGIKVDFIQNAGSSEQVLDLAEAENINFIVIVKQQASFSTPKNFKPIRIKGTSPRVDIDVTTDELIPKLNILLTTKDKSSKDIFLHHRSSSLSSNGNYHASNKQQSSSLVGNSVGTGGGMSGLDSKDSIGSGGDLNSSDKSWQPNKITILSEGKVKGGKKNQWKIEENARTSVSRLFQELSIAPVYSLDVKNDILDAILVSSLDQPEEWKRKVVGLSPSQKAYLMETQNALSKEVARGTPYVILYSRKANRTVIYPIVQNQS